MDLERLIVVQHLPGKEETVGEAFITYRKKTAERLMRGAEKKIFTIYGKNEYKEKFGRLPVEENITYALKEFTKKIEANPIKARSGGNGEKLKSCTEDLFGQDIRLYSGNRKSWQMFTRDIVRDSIKAEAAKRGLTISGLVETILIKWLNENTDSKMPLPNEFPPYAIVGYAVGQVSKIEKEKLLYSDIEGFIYNPSEKIKNVKRRLEQSGLFTEDIDPIFNLASKQSEKISEKQKIYFYAGTLGIDINVFEV